VTSLLSSHRLSRLRRPEEPVSPWCVAFNAVRDDDNELVMNSNGFAQQSTGISPAMLNAFQNQQQPKVFTNALNPSQLMNGAGPMQQMGASLNPAALQQQQQQQQTSFNINNMLNSFGISREQFQALSTQDRHVLGQKYIQMVNQQHQQQNQGQLAQPQVTHPQGPYERPSSSASNQGPQQNTMLPPPPHRPPTAQGTAQISRPGTSFSHRSPTIPGSGPANLAALMERPQSRLVRFSFPSHSVSLTEKTFLISLTRMESSNRVRASLPNRLSQAHPRPALPNKVASISAIS